MPNESLHRINKGASWQEKSTENQGFSLVEVLIAAAILGFILLSIANLFVLSMYAQNSSKRQNQLIVQGNRMMDFLSSLSNGDTLTPPHPKLSDYTINWPTCRGQSGGKWLYNYKNCWQSTDQNHRWPETASQFKTEYDPTCYCYIIWGVQSSASSPAPFKTIRMVVMPASFIMMVPPREITGIVSRDLNW